VTSNRPIVIGSGPNGLAAAFYLAKAGLAPIVLERRERVGGGAATAEIAPGFHCPVLSHEMLVHEGIVAEMRLMAHGLELLDGGPDVCAIAPDSPALVIDADAARTSQRLRDAGVNDARAWEPFRTAIAGAVAVLAPMLTVPPPDLDSPAAGDVLRLLGAGRRLRGLGRREAHRVLRWLPMPIADLLDEWFEDERLKAVVAGAGVSGTMLGPRSAGSALVLLLREAHRRLAGGRPLRARGGPGALAQAMAAAAREAGAEIRLRTAARRILAHGGRITGVVTDDGEIAASTVVSAIDPKTTVTSLMDPQDVAPEILLKFRNYRASGTVAKVNLALSALPAFAGAGRETLSGRIHIGPSLDYLERAFDHVKYGEVSDHPWLDMTIPSVLDPALAPAGAHVASIYVHCAPVRPRDSQGAAVGQRLLERSLSVLEACAPGTSRLVVGAQVITPGDLEVDHGLAGGHIFHGELAPDQLYAMRPILGFGRYAGPARGLYLCSGGTHPGGFLTGASGRLGALQVIRDNPRRS
jgi:phytoene dehydrogenase-like protein